MNLVRVISELTEKKIEYREELPMSAYTTFKIGGTARLGVFPKSTDEAVLALSVLKEAEIPFLIVGNGSNMLVSDHGFDGAAIVLTGMKAFSADGTVLTVSSGASLTHIASEAAKLSLTGLEFAYGIPGTVGGGVYMNAGAYGGEMSQVVIKSEYYDIITGERGMLMGDEHEFAYRHSTYMGKNRLILSAHFSLSHGDPEDITAKMSDFMLRRRDKQPLEYPSAGSVFKRGNGFITAHIIDQAGLKGRRVGGAEVSQKHAGFIVNRGGATAADVTTLVEIVKKEVKAKFGYDLECEIEYIG